MRPYSGAKGVRDDTYNHRIVPSPYVSIHRPKGIRRIERLAALRALKKRARRLAKEEICRELNEEDQE